MLANSQSISFVASCNLAISRAFYEDTLGLTVVLDEHHALVFDLDGHVLRVTMVEDLVPAKHTILGWNVIDISATIKMLVGRGAIFERFDGMEQDELGIWTSPSGAKVAWFKDPDDNNLSVTQMASSNVVSP